MQPLPQRLCRDRPLIRLPMPRVFRPGALQKVVPRSLEQTSLINFVGRYSQRVTRMGDVLLLGLRHSVIDGLLPDPCVEETDVFTAPASLMACRRPGPTSAQPISSKGPTASNAALPFCPARSGSVTFKARVITLENTDNRRAGRNRSRLAPRSARYRVPSSKPMTDKSTAGATNGGTPNRSASVHTLPKPDRNVSARRPPP